MTNRSRLLLVMMALVSIAAAMAAEQSAAPRTMPAYDSGGALTLPRDWRQWVFVGSSLGLS